MAMPTHRRTTLLLGILLACLGWWSDGDCASDSKTTIAGRVRSVAGGTIPAQPNSRFTVVVVDEAGRIVARQSTRDVFRVTVPSDHDYVLGVAKDDGVYGLLIWGEQERPEFTAHGPAIDLGYVALNRDTNRAVALREFDLRRPRTTMSVAREPLAVAEE